MDTRVVIYAVPIDHPLVPENSAGHSFTVLTDTETDEQIVLEAGRDAGVFDSTLFARIDNASDSLNLTDESKQFVDSALVEGDFSDVAGAAKNFAKAIEEADISYDPTGSTWGPNSNSVAGEFFEQTTGRSPVNRSSLPLPGISNNVIKERPPSFIEEHCRDQQRPSCG